MFRGSVHPRSMGRNRAQLEGFIRDWGANFSWELVAKADQPGHVCQGFQSLLDEVWPALQSRLSGLANRTVWVTGFSQGRALAVLAGRRLQQAGLRRAAACTPWFAASRHRRLYQEL